MLPALALSSLEGLTPNATSVFECYGGQKQSVIYIGELFLSTDGESSEWYLQFRDGHGYGVSFGEF